MAGTVNCTRHRRYRVGNLTLMLMRSDGTSATTNSIPQGRVRLSKIFGAVGAGQQPTVVGNPHVRLAINALGTASGSITSMGELGVTTGNATPVDILAIGR
jgi:hypothetical protein